MPCDSKLVKIIGMAVCLLLGGCSGLDLLNAVVPSGGYRIVADQAFGSTPAQKVDVLIPKDLTAGERRPVVLFFYGGSWKSGSRAEYRFAGEALTSKGFVAVIADYRHFPEVKFPTFQADAALALRWTVDHIAEYNGNPDAIFVMGHSAGAHMGALLAVDGAYTRAAGVKDGAIKGFIGLAGPYAMVPSQVNSIRDVFAGLPDENVARPVHFVTAAGPKPPPMLLLYGLGDKTVGRANAREFAARARSAGGEASVIEYPDLTHPGIILALAPYFRGRAPVLEDAAAFVNRHAAIRR
ncbi:MAG: alpha/beta hydrolase [Rhodospirillaceae bacterium]|nr:alpha/beta hydrolase [Rhodospirillaceae bacterium]